MSGLSLPAWTMLLPIFGYLAAVVAAILSVNGKNALRPVSSLITTASALIGVVVAVSALLDNETRTLRGWELFNGIQIGFRLDSLAAFFLLVISFPAIAAAIYGIGYLDSAHEPGHAAAQLPQRAGIDGAAGAFLASMSLLVLADGIFGFLIAWEAMSLTSFFLVIGDGANTARRSAAYTYVVMTHIATGFILFAFLGLAQHAGSFNFTQIAGAAGSLGAWQRDATFFCALLGFGTKAGLIPLHIWLPKAHPAAPSHISALMSGVMVKTAIYGLIRIIFELAGPGPRWWGTVLILAGIVSAVMGILYSLMERDLKRGLAYSTVEHLGIITLGLGIATLLFNDDRPELAAFALFAVLIHLLNHAAFKSLLFLGAGAVQTATGTRDLERLGGLIKRMPRTAIFVLIGAASISALPPLNGFAGEWLLFQSLLKLGGSDDTAPIATLAGVGAAALALTGALAVACFIRLFGIGFLAQPRTDEAANAHEVSKSMQFGMGLLATCCLFFGIGVTFLLRLIEPVVAQLSADSAPPPVLFARGVSTDSLQGSYAPLFVALGLVVVGILPWAVARGLFGKVGRRIAPPWVCGFRIETGMQYTATAFSKPLRLMFQFVIRPDRTVVIDHPDSPYFVTGVHYDETVRPIYERYIYDNLVRGLFGFSRLIRPMQGGSIRAYLGYVLVTLILVIVLAR